MKMTKRWIGWLATLVLLAGCANLDTGERLAQVRSVAENAAWVGAVLDLQANPQRRPAYTVALRGLEAIADSDSFSPAALRAALADLPALVGSDGALLDAGVSLYVLITGTWVDVETVPVARAVTLGVRDGLRRALAVPAPGPEGQARQPVVMPKQIAVPVRK
jgi:hypothetical protein